MTDKRNHCNNDFNLDRMSCGAKPTDDLRHEIAEDESDRAIRERVDAGAQEIKSQKLKEEGREFSCFQPTAPPSCSKRE